MGVSGAAAGASLTERQLCGRPKPASALKRPDTSEGDGILRWRQPMVRGQLVGVTHPAC